MNSEFIKQSRELLAKITVDELQGRIAHFKQLNIGEYKDEELDQALRKIFEVEVSGEAKSVLIITSEVIGENFIYPEFYRIRPLTEHDRELKDFASMRTEQDAWWAPEQYVNYGRLNRQNESLLYVGDTIETAIREARLKAGALFYLMVYRSKRSFEAVHIGLWKNAVTGLTGEENMKLRLINDFLRDEFVQIVEKGEEGRYRITEVVAKKYFIKPTQDAWCYPSIANEGLNGYVFRNLCFTPTSAKSCLELLGVRVCRLIVIDGINRILPMLDGIGFDEEGRFIYHLADSDLSKSTFMMMNGSG